MKISKVFHSKGDTDRPLFLCLILASTDGSRLGIVNVIHIGSGSFQLGPSDPNTN